MYVKVITVVEDRCRGSCQNRQEGGWLQKIRLNDFFSCDTNLTRTDQTARPVRLRVQNRTFRGLGASATTDSGGISGKTGLVSSSLAEVVGKYILLGRREMIPEPWGSINLFI